MLNIYTNSIFYKHDTGIGHPESSRRLDAALSGVDRAGSSDRVLRDVSLHPDTDRIIHKTHSREYEKELEDACRAGFRLFHSMDNPISSASFGAARVAVATSIAAADAVWREKSASRAFVVARPPGHHAERAEAMGFCFFNTIA
jgi:acetoin utilization deacetylase AcuC-like enzyme